MSKFSQKVYEFRITRLRDENAYSEFYKDQYARTYRFVKARINQPEHAEDITDEAFLQVWRYIFVEHQQVEYLTALLFTIARRLIIDHYRSDIHSHEHQLDDLGFFSDEGSLLSKLEVRADTTVVRKALENIRGEYREVIILRFLDEFEMTEISAVLGKSPGAVRVLIHRALRAIRDELKSNGS